MLIAFISLVLFQFLILLPSCYIIPTLMLRIKIDMSKNRKIIVKIYKLVIRCNELLTVTNSLAILMKIYSIIYYSLIKVLMIISKSYVFSEYVALSINLVMIQPLTCLFIKIVKKNLYKDTKQKEMRGLETDVLNLGKIVISKLPIKGIIHIINLVLVVLVNSFKALNIDTSITTTSVYMSIATFYAIDKTVEYFAKRYNAVLEKFDNKLFNTREIDSNVNFDLKQLRDINERIFNNYIETGKFELPDK